jgi:tetratricopeptide (TPR) repeat protein
MSRYLRNRLLVLGGVAVFLLLALVRHVPPGSLAVLQNRVGRPNPVLISEGLHWRIPFWEEIAVYPPAPVRVRDEVEVTSREKAEVQLPLEFEALLDEERILRAHREGSDRDARAWIRRRAAEAVRVVAGRAATYQLLREELPSALEKDLRRELEPLGLVAESLRVGPGRVSPEVLEAYDPERLSRMRRHTGLKIALIGLDGADWEFALPMIERGELPNLARLRREGAHGRIRTNQPPLSPLLWTTVATGKSPDVHGIIDFLVLDAATGRMTPITSEYRKVKALWNIVSDAGLTAEFVAWWATWPAEPIRGILVSDRVSYSLFSFVAGEAPAGGETYPEGYFQEIQPQLRREQDVSYEELRRFVRIPRSEFEAARDPRARRGLEGEDAESVATLIRVLASTENYYRIGMDLLGRSQPDLFGIYFQGIDEVGHRFAHLAPPRMPDVSPDRFSRYSGALAAFYRHQDRLLGRLLERLEPETIVLLLSDHGFASGSARPADVPPFIEGQPGLWHTPFGILVASGPGVRPGPLPVASLYDIAPTVLDLLGLPAAEDLPGRSLRKELMEAEFEGGGALSKVASYEAFGDPLRPARDAGTAGSGAAASEAMIETLRSLGYVGPAPVETTRRGTGEPGAGSATTALYHANLAAILSAKGDLDGAEEEYRKALRSNPDTLSALLGLSRLLDRKGRPDQALTLLQRVVERRMRYDPAVYIRMAELFGRTGRAEDGKGYLGRLAAEHPEEPLLDVARGVLYSRLGETEPAERFYRKALSRDPLSIPPMEELFILYDGRGRLPGLIPELEAAVRREDGSFMHHNWLGLAYRRAGNLSGAERELRRALELGPDQAGPGANLGSLLIQQGRLEEAVEVLEKALGRDSSSLETRTNLIVALGRLGRLPAAQARFEEAGRLGQLHPPVLSAMAFALRTNGKVAEAVRLLRRSLEIDPEQPEALRLLREIDPGALPPKTP